MSFRNLSPQEMFIQMAKCHCPKYRFKAEKREDFEAWKKKALPEVLAPLGDAPQTVPPEPQLLVEWNENKLRRQKWLINVAPFISATLLINYPKEKPADKLPAILCCHGHGPYGKDVVMGDDTEPDRKAQINQCNYDYGRQMAEAGFITYAIDWIGFGERNDANRPNNRNPNIGGRDWCNIYYLHATMLGMTSLSINIAHGKAATDFICSLPDVDKNHLGVMGLSGGGTMTTWMALCDTRFKAAEIICYSDLFAHFGIRDLNYCGMQVAPGLFKLVDLPELQGLIAPRPLLVDIGVQDQCFRVDTAMECFRQVKRIYAVAGASENLELDLHSGNHGWGANRSIPFFKKYLS